MANPNSIFYSAPLSLSIIQKSVRAGEYSISTLLEYYIQNIEQSREHNIYAHTYFEEARRKAQALDGRIQTHSDNLGKLWGMIISIKDVIAYKDHPLHAASNILNGYYSSFNATAVQKILDEDGIIIGSTNCDEFAMGSTSEFTKYGSVRNGFDKSLVAGGSSGGAAVSVQMQTCLVALGSDTGGSVRQPAAFTGIYGFKPTYGRISRFGLIAYASSFDQIGVLANNTEDIAIVLECIAGFDPKDATSSQQKVGSYKINHKSQNYKIAILDDINTKEGMSLKIREDWNLFLKRLNTSGNTIYTRKLDFLEYLIPAYYVLTTAEASSNLGRYDGVRYGNRIVNSNDLMDMYVSTRSEGFGKEVKRRIMLGSFVLSAGYYDAYYNKAQQLRRKIKDKVDKIFEEVDFICLPTTTTDPWKIGELPDDPVKMYLSDVFTVLANICGIPAVSIPLKTNEKQLPTGIQVLAPAFKEEKLLHFSNNLKLA